MTTNDYLDRRDVLKLIGISDPTLRKYWRNGTFPRPVEWTERTIKFKRSEVEEWMRTRKPKQSAA